MKERWEKLKDEWWTEKMEVDGGYIYKHEAYDNNTQQTSSVAMVFVPATSTKRAVSLPPAD
jgi:hypothetical protein